MSDEGLAPGRWTLGDEKTSSLRRDLDGDLMQVKEAENGL